MDDEEDVGESSRKTRADQDDQRRPFKKARYVWQLKGKYHLKQQDSGRAWQQQQASLAVTAAPEHAVESVAEAVESSDSDSEGDQWRSNNNNMSTPNRERCCINDFLAHSNAMLDPDEPQDLTTNNIDKSIMDEIPVTLVTSNNKNLDEYLHKWQARQVAKSFVDNTINTILEHWKIAPFDATDFVENCETGEQVEDEGILMAIQSHGLQSSIRQTAANLNEGEPSRFHTEAYNDCYQNDESPQNDSGRQSPLIQHDLVSSSTRDNDENLEVERLREEDGCDDEQVDFLNAAVAVAIQKKGLSSYSYG